jgi:hypothetical protein
MKAEDLGPFVEKLALRIATFAPHTNAHIKAAVNQGFLSHIPENVLSEVRQSDLCVASDITRQRVQNRLRLGIETYDGELRLWKIVDKLSCIHQKYAKVTSRRLFNGHKPLTFLIINRFPRSSKFIAARTINFSGFELE